MCVRERERECVHYRERKRVGERVRVCVCLRFVFSSLFFFVPGEGLLQTWDGRKQKQPNLYNGSKFRVSGVFFFRLPVDLMKVGLLVSKANSGVPEEKCREGSQKQLPLFGIQTFFL